MTRKDYELLAATFAKTRPDPDGALYRQWERDVRALCDALETDNPAFDRSRFQFAATQPDNNSPEGRATVWLVDYRFNVRTRDEALQAAGAAAVRDVPEATVQYMRDRRTPKGTWVVTLKRTRKVEA